MNAPAPAPRPEHAAAPVPRSGASAAAGGIAGILASAAWMVGFAMAYISSEILPLRFRDKWMPLLLLALVLVALRHRVFTAMRPFINPGMTLILGWMFLSAAWSPDPVFTLTQAIAMVGINIIALAFCVVGWTPDRFERQLSWVIGLMLAASAAVAFAYPALGVHSESSISLASAWRGITFQKNALGQLSVFGLILWTYLWAAGKVRAMGAMFGIGLSLLCLLGSRSSTSLMLGLMCSGGVIAILRPPLQIGWIGRRAVIIFIAVVLPLGIYLAVATPYLGFIGSYFGKDGTFSGRTFVWDAIIAEMRHRPWLGTGLSGFWGGLDPGEKRVQAAVGWPVRNGHNGYLDVANELGLIGLGLFIAFLAWYSVALARLAKISRRHYAFHLPMFIYLLLANTSESGWFFPIAPTHLMGMYTSLEISRLLFANALYRRGLPPRVTSPPLPMVVSPPRSTGPGPGRAGA